MDLLFSKMNNILKKVEEKYSNENIFGIFKYENLTKTAVIVIPTFEDVCLNRSLIRDDIVYLDENIKVLDIRFTYEATKNGYPYLIDSLYTDYYIVNPKYEHMFINLFKRNRDIFKAGIECGKPPEELKIAIMKIMRTVFNDNSAAVRFIKQTTDIEKTAIEQIIIAVGDEGIFSQAKVASAAGISRAAMTNLIRKMAESGVATIIYMGNKGTYFKIIDDTLLRIRG